MVRLLLIALLLFSASPALASFQALLDAARMNDLSRAQTLLAEGAPPDGDTSGRSSSYSPLQWAARHGNDALIGLLLTRGARVDQRDFNGDRALLWAADDGHVEAVRLLLAAGAAVQSLDDPFYRTPLMVAAGSGHVEAVRVLLTAGADPTSRDHSGDSALHYAAMWGGIGAVRALLDSEATDPNAIESILYRTPLWHAAMHDDAEMVEALIRGGASTRPRDSDGRTALLAAATAGRAASVAALLALGAEADERDRDGATPLLLAIGSGSVETVRAIKDAGGSLAATDAAGRGIDYYLTQVRTLLPSHRIGADSRAAPFEPDWAAIAVDIAQKRAAIRAMLGLEPE